MSKKRLTGYTVLFALLLTGCAVLENAPTIREAIGYGYITVTSLAESAIELNEAGNITDAERAEVKVKLERALVSLDSATNHINYNDTVNSLGALNSALVVIQAVTMQLERGGG